MKMVPKYTKVMNLGNSGTERALVGEVIIQEKIDGSQFRFGLNEDGEFVMGSKAVNWEYEQWDKMFKPGCEYLLSIEDTIKETFKPDTYFYAEYMLSEKHNVLKYGRVPKNHFVLFDCLMAGEWVRDRKQLQFFAHKLGVDVVPELYRGVVEMQRVGSGPKFDHTRSWTGIDFMKNMIGQTMSILGEVQIEGIVIKNYNEWLTLGGQVYPVFTKYVREAYREQHMKDWKVKAPKASLQDYFQGFNNENRWLKSIQHLKEKGELTNTVKDIGALLKEIQSDIKAEETDNIKQVLFNHFIKDLMRTSIRGFPEWYKDYLISENLQGDEA